MGIKLKYVTTEQSTIEARTLSVVPRSGAENPGWKGMSAEGVLMLSGMGCLGRRRTSAVLLYRAYAESYHGSKR